MQDIMPSNATASKPLRGECSFWLLVSVLLAPSKILVSVFIGPCEGYWHFKPQHIQYTYMNIYIYTYIYI